MADKYYNDHCQKVLGIIHHGLSTAADGLLTIVQATIVQEVSKSLRMKVMDTKTNYPRTMTLQFLE